MAKAVERGAIEGELLPRSTEALEEQEALFKRGFRQQALAVLVIFEQELFRAAGFKTFVDYARERLVLPKTNAYRLIDAGRVFVAAEGTHSPIGEKITHAELLRPLSGMKSAAGKVKVIEKAVKLAEKQGGVITGKLVEAVARDRPFNWKPKREYQKTKKRAKEGKDEVAVRRKLRHDIELAFSVLLGLRKAGWELHQALGNLDTFIGAHEVKVLLQDWEDSGT